MPSSVKRCQILLYEITLKHVGKLHIAVLHPANHCRRIPCLSCGLAQSDKAVQTIEGRGFIAFRKRRIIEKGVHEIADLALQQEYRLPDM